jgi:hypothetical protein
MQIHLRIPELDVEWDLIASEIKTAFPDVDEVAARKFALHSLAFHSRCFEWYLEQSATVETMV